MAIKKKTLYVTTNGKEYTRLADAERAEFIDNMAIAMRKDLGDCTEVKGYTEICAWVWAYVMSNNPLTD